MVGISVIIKAHFHFMEFYSKKEVNMEKKFEKNRKEHAPDCTCSICGLNYKGFTFKHGFVCESCLEYIKDSFQEDSVSDRQNA